MIETICLTCHCVFMSYPKQARKYCSHTCYWKAKKTYPTSAICRACGKEFRPDPSSNRVFCNRGCYRTWRASKTQYVITICQHCGKEIKKPRKRAWAHWKDGKPLPRKYCSRGCADRARVGKYIDEHSPQWRGGRTTLQDIIRKSNAYEDCREKCFERDNYRSILSGMGGRLVHHHIVPYSTLFSVHKITKGNWRQFGDILFDPQNVATLRAVEHRKFHAQYGKVSTPDQFRQYQQSYTRE